MKALNLCIDKTALMYWQCGIACVDRAVFVYWQSMTMLVQSVLAVPWWCFGWAGVLKAPVLTDLRAPVLTDLRRGPDEHPWCCIDAVA